MFSNKLTKILSGFIACIIINVQDSSANGDFMKPVADRFALDVSDCSLYHKLCSHLEDDLAILSCSLNASYNKTLVASNCQHKIWTHQNYLLDNAYLDYKLSMPSKPCQDEPTVLSCIKASDHSMDCILKKKSGITNKNCWRIMNKIESLIFNDWQITGTFLKNCYDDIQAHACGRIPADAKSLSQSQTLKCLQSNEQKLRPECTLEINVLEDMKYDTLQLDKIIFAACNVDQKTFCPDELSGSWLMYKCLLRHKYENSKFYMFVIECLVITLLLQCV